MNQEALAKLIEFVQGASPQVWDIAMRQVYVELLRNGLVAVSFLVAGTLLFRLSRQKLRLSDFSDLDYDMWVAVCAVSIACLAIGWGIFLGELPILINPQWEAINLLLGMVK